jgi:hypothetical protein
MEVGGAGGYGSFYRVTGIPAGGSKRTRTDRNVCVTASLHLRIPFRAADIDYWEGEE